MRVARGWIGLVGLAAVFATLAAPSVGMAAGPLLPVGEANGVRVERQQGARVIVFTKRAASLYRKIAGRRVVVDCVGMPKVTRGVHWSSGGETPMTAPKRRRPLRPGEASRGLDYCTVWLAARKHYSRVFIVSVPITQAGAVHVDETAKAFMLQALMAFAGREAVTNEGGYPTPALLLGEDLVGRLWRTPLWGRGPQIVPLTSPGDTPPARALGYYSDGRQHAAAAIVSASGRRLFFEVGPDDVLHTNVADYVFGDLR